MNDTVELSLDADTGYVVIVEFTKDALDDAKALVDELYAQGLVSHGPLRVMKCLTPVEASD